jgi:hypothetical protein
VKSPHDWTVLAIALACLALLIALATVIYLETHL